MGENITVDSMKVRNAVDWKHTALLVVDMQNDFISGCLTVAGGASIVHTVKKAVYATREKGGAVIWVVRHHDASGRDVELFRRYLYPDGVTGPVIKGTPGAELVEGLEPVLGEHILVKSRFSAFFATNLDLILRRMGITNVVIAGVQTPNCIRGTAFDAISLDYPSVVVLSDATAAETPEIHAANLLDMQNVNISIQTLEQWSKQ